MTITCTVRIGFDTAKRLRGFTGPCANLHGYHHMAEARFAPLGKAGNIVMDFAEIERILGGWVRENWDHNLILNKQDKLLGEAVRKITGQKVFYLETDPSAEALAEYLLKTCCPKLFKKYKVKCNSVRLYDTPDCWVEAEL